MASFSRSDLPAEKQPVDARSVSDESDSSNEEGWEDVEQEDDSQPVVDLFSETVYPDVRSMLKVCKDKHNFDLLKIQKQLGMYPSRHCGSRSRSSVSEAEATNFTSD